MADACHHHARHLSYALPCTIFIVPSLYVVGSIAIGRRSSAVLAIIATLPPSRLSFRHSCCHH
ncbi:hypothetical protein DL95DRAFT_395817 [Leptodontidium sp. 2 PMI_412]|nr:hypothetical protein DL95DRAFT_395817 [Leptodontidium sp. 2 PMI_412]